MDALSEILRNPTPFVAIYHVPEPPEGSEAPDPDVHCVFKSMFLPATEGRTMAARKDQMGCGGSHSGLGMGGEDDRGILPEIYSTGRDGKPGRRYWADPGAASAALGFVKVYGDSKDVCVMEPVEKAEARGAPIETVAILTDNLRVSALTTLAGFRRRSGGPVVHAMHAFACEELYALPKGEEEREDPSAYLGATELYVRRFLSPEQVTFAVPYSKYSAMREDAPESFLATKTWDDAVGGTEKKCPNCG